MPQVVLRDRCRESGSEGLCLPGKEKLLPTLEDGVPNGEAPLKLRTGEQTSSGSMRHERVCCWLWGPDLSPSGLAQLTWWWVSTLSLSVAVIAYCCLSTCSGDSSHDNTSLAHT